MNNNKQFVLNLAASITAFVINLGINFKLSPYITSSIGVEAYGFVYLGSNFYNYISLITAALNSMAGRFITIEIHRENCEEANIYFNSVFAANILAAAAMFFPSVFFIHYIDRIINVPLQLLPDVKLLFSYLFTCFVIEMVFSCFSVSTFATNRLYLQSLRNSEGVLIRCALLIILFFFFRPKVSFLGLAAMVVLIYKIIFNVYYTKKFLPQIEIKRIYFKTRAVIKLISSGIWNTIGQAGQLLLDGVDLLISNLLISTTVMGTLALAKTVPILISSLVGVIAGIFMPEFTILYARSRKEELLNSVKPSMKLLGIIVNVPAVILVCFGDVFYRLWIPSQKPLELQLLSVIIVTAIVVSGPLNSICGVFTVTDKLKLNSLILILTGLINVAVVFVLIKTTNLGVYAIAGVNTFLCIIRNLVFVAPYGARCLGLKWNTFYPEIIRSVSAFIAAAAAGLILHNLVSIHSWIMFFVISGITTFISLLASITIALVKDERKLMFKVVKNRLSQMLNSIGKTVQSKL